MTGDEDSREIEGIGRIGGFRCVAICAFMLLGICGSVRGEDVNEPANGFTGELHLSYQNFLVDKDEGRFREDHWMTDNSTGGVDRLSIHAKPADANGYEWTVDARAVHDYDYGLKILARKKDSHYLLLEFTGMRRYYDGSNEAWESSPFRLAERTDDDLFVDRRTYGIEIGRTPENGLGLVFGWHRLVKDGKEVLLRGSEGVSSSGGTFSSVPVVANVRGITDTLYVEAARTFFEKYNVRVRQEFEQYRENRRSDISSYDNAGVVANSDILYDDLGYTNQRTTVMFDSFLNDETYVTANYMYNYLRNDSSRDDVGYHEHTTFYGGNSRKTNAGTFGYRKDHVFNVDRLSLIFGARIEDSRTKGYMVGESKYYNFQNQLYVGPKPRMVRSRLHETPVSEMIRLVYRGMDRTVLSFEADLEQNAMRRRERDMHGGVLSDPDISRKTDIDLTDQVYPFKAVHRFSRKTKSTVKFRVKDLERSYADHRDDNAYYPGYLDDYRITGEEVSVSLDRQMENDVGVSLLYQYVSEAIDTSIGGTTQNMDIHRGAGSVSFSPRENLFLVGTFMVEDYRLNTPAIGTAANHAGGSGPYDYRGNSYSILLDGTYALNSNTSCTFGVRHTEAMGEADHAGDYSYDSVETMVKLRISERKTMGVGYQFVNFNDHAGGFDDYQGHGLMMSYTCRF